MRRAAAYSQWNCIMHSAKESLLHRLQCEQYPHELCSIQSVQPNNSPGEEESQPDRGLVREKEVKLLPEKLWYNGFKFFKR